jgi:epoxyqueuosine reductase
MGDSVDIKQIQHWAAELGFAKVGFAHPNMAQAAERHVKWIQSGHHGEMAYLARRLEERADPSLLLPGLKSAIVVSQHYAGPGDVFAELADPARGYIARYARGAKDYHDIFKTQLMALGEKLANQVPGFEFRAYVDTGPILEKNLAAQAGIGWQGKHTNLIDPTGGSWFFLGTILTNLDLPAAEPIEDHCGTCRDCLDICPTNAFIGPYQLDASRCISYLTIELKGPIPKDLRPLIGNRIFGCDDCLAVCPWNRFAPTFINERSNRFAPDLVTERSNSDGLAESGPAGPAASGNGRSDSALATPSLSAHAEHGAYAPRPITDGASLIELMSLSREAFTKHFKRTPLFRTKRRGLLRNVAVALGNWGDPAAIPVLTTALTDDEPLIRGHAAWALGQIGTESARFALRQAQNTEADAFVMEEIQDALG